MLKILGSLCIIVSTILWGAAAARQLGKNYEHMRMLEQLLNRLRNEIRYSRSSLREVFAKIGLDFDGPFQQWMHQMNQRMQQKEGESFSAIWKETVEKCLSDCGIPERDRERLLEIGRQLGDADLDGQIRAIELYLEELKHSMEDMRTELKSKEKLCHCLGVMSGIFIVILLL